MHADETRARILAATDALFSSVGFDAATTRDIAVRAGVNKALIHYHFGSKAELLDVLLDGYYDRLTKALVGALQGCDEPEAQAHAVVSTYSDFLAENTTFCSIVQREVASGRHVDKIVARTLPVFQLGRHWLQQIAPSPSEGFEIVHVLTTVYGLVVSYFTYAQVLGKLDGEDPLSEQALASRRRHVQRVVALLFREMRGVSGPSQEGAPS